MRFLKSGATLLICSIPSSRVFGLSSSLLRFNRLSRAHSSSPLQMSTFSTYNPDKEYSLVLDDFAVRQFNNPDYTGTQVHYDLAKFETQINQYFASGKYPLVDGYAPFCKHVFVPNFAGVKCGYAKISSENEKLIKSGYEARKEGELAVLVQWIDQNELPPPDATHLDIILYSRDQITKENIAMGSTPPDSRAPWGIISVKGQLCDYELPMQPITMMRNALGKEEGGSGVPLEKSKYQESLDFWTKHVAIK